MIRIFFLNTLNSLVYLLTLGRKVLHEGHFRRGFWRNWNRTFSSKPRDFVIPETEQDISLAVKEPFRKVRVVGGGHSFNSSWATDDRQLSLDRYNKILRVDAQGIVRVQAGIRLRDLNKQLEEYGLAFPVLGSTDAQSIGGLLATDLHGTGRKHGFLSEQVQALRIMDAEGRAKEFPVESEVCRGAMGGLGTCGVITEVELKCVPSFNLEKSSQLIQRARIEQDIEGTLEGNDHVSLYYLGGVNTENVRMNIWKRTEQAPCFLPRVRKMVGELFDVVFSGFLLGTSRSLHRHTRIANFGFFCFKLLLDRKRAVYPSARGFSRKLFFIHDELEYGIPRHAFRDCLRDIDEMLRQERFVAIIEVRFTPDTSRALLGPGVGRSTCHIELAPSLSYAPERIRSIYVQAEQIFQRYGGQPHLGKGVPSLERDPEALQRVYAERFDRFQQVRQAQDPHGKFLNEFTKHVFAKAERHMWNTVRTGHVEPTLSTQDADAPYAS